MAYRFDSYDQALVIDGWENGVADSPHKGLSDMRNVNVVSIPGEASILFSTVSNVNANQTGTVTSANAGADTVLLVGNPAQLQAVIFSGGSLPTGIVAGTVYWAVPTTGGNYQLYTDYGGTSVLDITGNGTGSWATVNMSQPKYFTHLSTPFMDAYFMVDSAGLVWSTFIDTPIGNWRYTGNTTTGSNGTTHGNGIVSYVPSDSGSSTLGYVFVFRDFQIDYATITSNTTLTWTYGWNPSDGSPGNNNYLKNASTGGNASVIHEAFAAPDNRIYYCDAGWVGKFYEISGQAFRPATTSTYTYDPTYLLPANDTTQCLTYLGGTLLIGGKNNLIYPWDRFSPNVGLPVIVAETNIQKMITINTNTYALVGSRGRIYVTNGTNASLYKKVPDHISGTVEPYFTWGGICSSKNQLYFSCKAISNSGTVLSNNSGAGYGGIWAIDIDTSALRLVNKLSYGSYNGFASAIISNFSTDPAGAGLYIGWDDGNSGFGIDTTTSNLYTNSEVTIDTDLIPIGTYNKPRDFTQLEYRLTKALVSGESVTIKTRLIFNTSDTGYSTGWTDSTVGHFSNTNPIDFQQAQWVQFQIVLKGTNSSPSYVRLKEIRILGLVGPTLATSQNLSL